MAETVLISVRHVPLLDQIRDFLQRAGYTVLESQSPVDALNMLSSPWCGIDLLLADATIRDAPQFVRQTISRQPRLKVLMISGDPDYVNRELMPEPEIAFIEKPFAWCELKHAIAELLTAQPVSCEAASELTASYAS
jgi:DNA-binding NtrC family response regulator